jgi:hypothetical protein
VLQEIVCKSVFMYSYVSQRLFVRDDEKQHHSLRFNKNGITEYKKLERRYYTVEPPITDTLINGHLQ